MTVSKLSQATIAVIFAMVVLSMMGSSSPPPVVLSMKTGYDYSATVENPTPADLYRDLKCTYLFAAMTHVRWVRHMLDDKNTPTHVPAFFMDHYNIRAAICTLYGVAYVDIGTLWILLLYVNMAKPYYNVYVHKAANNANRTAAVNHLGLVHNYVTDRMQRELLNSDCPNVSNRFDSYDDRYGRLKRAVPSGRQLDRTIFEIEATINCNELNDLLEANKKKFAVNKKRYEALKQRALFLDKLADNNKQKKRMMNGYDLQVSWKRAPALLTEFYRDAIKLYSHPPLFLPLLPIKMYYLAVFGLIKCIAYRLTLKFLFYFKNMLITGESRENYLKLLHGLLVKIQTRLRLQDDPDVLQLLEYIDQLGRNIVGVDCVITQLQDRMHRFENFLECQATNSWILNLEQPSSSGDQGTPGIVDTIDNILLGGIRKFINDLQYAFRTVDFDVVRSIVEYVDDQRNW